MKKHPCRPPRLPLPLDYSLLEPYLQRASDALRLLDSRLQSLSSPRKQLFLFEVSEACTSLKPHGYNPSLEETVESLQKKTKDSLSVQSYLRALQYLHKKHLKIDLAFFERLQGILVKHDLRPKQDIGHIRSRQNWIGPLGCKEEEALFYPPPYTEVEKYLQKLNQYLLIQEKEPLVQLGVAINQFLLIHPFMDGNGRVSRVLIPYFLWKKKALSLPYFSLSAYFLEKRSLYFKKLFYSSTKHKWAEWLRFFLRGVIEECALFSEKIEKVELLTLELRTSLLRFCSRKETERIVHFLFKTPIFTKKAMKKTCKSSREIHKILYSLQKDKLIERYKGNRYIFTDLFRLCSERKKNNLGKIRG